MATIINLDINEIVFESDDLEAIKAEADRLGLEWHKEHESGLPYLIQGFDSVELESGILHPEYKHPDPPPNDKDRIVIDEKKNTVTVHGDAEPPLDFDGKIINVT